MYTTGSVKQINLSLREEEIVETVQTSGKPAVERTSQKVRKADIQVLSGTERILCDGGSGSPSVGEHGTGCSGGQSSWKKTEPVSGPIHTGSNALRDA